MRTAHKSQVKPTLAARKPPAPQRQGTRFVVLFLVYILVGFVVLLAPYSQPMIKEVTRLVAGASAFFIRMFGGHAFANGDLLMGSSSVQVIRVANGCNGLHLCILLWAAVAAFPAPLAQKAKGLVLSTAALHAINLVRVISLFYLAPRSGVWFDLAHLYLWEALIVLLTFAVFWRWARSACPVKSAAARF